ncbi:Glyoxylase, beta-lactamase superfamily II [Moraxella cuniculi DSM 21768]|uniref:Glyoxylase, beta-lactamase superfamily II n=1 Tax=Moraxella cuniculi DSM 21768 TaxID=1122245 RepID=A0A1N7EU23_9GAMM|nr:MBL fold metallo-hydrolase [Moraxella cuniculi]OOS06352.1 MBL fold metallo-hydrolase [Moraxella cuniculi]SIR91583.1 Glyoxylase, beta-lactamase superfamily II [Moraxella cuniculi DSM 21768]
MKKRLLATLLAVAANSANALEIQTYSADANSFLVQSTLILGEKEAILIDSGFTRADALRIAAQILDSQKQLSTIFISQADPDYYFGAATLKEIFPDAKVITTPAVLEKINAKVATKLAVWSPKMGANAPKNIVLPEPFVGKQLSLDGETIEIRGTSGLLAHRPYVWIPSQKTIAGNVAVFGNMHLWTADTQSPAERQAWSAQLAEMASLKPAVVIAGHAAKGSKTDASLLKFNQEYLKKYEQVLANSKTSGEVISKMQQAYPKLTAISNLELGAKVNKGEMKW